MYEVRVYKMKDILLDVGWQPIPCTDPTINPGVDVKAGILTMAHFARAGQLDCRQHIIYCMLCAAYLDVLLDLHNNIVVYMFVVSFPRVLL